jgi:hypothetical protein
MMRRLIYGSAIAALLGLQCPQSPAAQPNGTPFELFSASEAAAWNAHNPNDRAAYSTRDLHAPAVPSCHDIPASSSQSTLIPQIKIVAPTLGKPLAAPLDIELEFLPAASAAIKPDTFRVCYVGFVTMDITKRITDHVTVSPQGLHVAGAQLPHGHHHLVMLIADQQGQIGSRDAVFDIL